MAQSQGTAKTQDQRAPASRKSADTTSDHASSVQEGMGALTTETATQVREAAAGVKEQVRQQAFGQVTTQKERAADGLEMVVGLLRQASQQVSEQDQAPVAVSIDGVADRIDAWSETLRTQDVSELVDSARELARRQPALFAGGAFVAGFLAVRFLKSSPPSASEGASPAESTASHQRSSSDKQETTVLNDLEDLETLLPSSNDDQANAETR